jgi:hypothetical protein
MARERTAALTHALAQMDDALALLDECGALRSAALLDMARSSLMREIESEGWRVGSETCSAEKALAFSNLFG